MFEELHLCPWALARHVKAPFADERARYMSYCAARGDSQATIATKANRLIYVARQLSKCPELDVAIGRLSVVACGGKAKALASCDISDDVTQKRRRKQPDLLAFLRTL